VEFSNPIIGVIEENTKECEAWEASKEEPKYSNLFDLPYKH
jgi:hypothetical protein